MTVVELRWRASVLTRSVTTCAALAFGVAVLTGRWDLIAFGAPLLAVLCSLAWQPPVPTVSVSGEPLQQRCFEGDQVQVTVGARADDGSTVAVTAVAPPGMTVDGSGATVAVQAPWWGRYPIEATVRALGRGGLLEGTGSAPAAQVCVFPVAPPQSTAIPRTELLDRLGTHLTRHIGPGVEYADIRPYVPGDQLRTVNWPVSARRGALHITERLTDRAADVVVLFDTYRSRRDRRPPQPSGPPAAPPRWCRARCATATAPASSHSAGAPPAGWVPTSAPASSTASSTRCSVRPAAATNREPAPSPRGRRCPRARSSSRSPPCSTPSSRSR
ncbi:MAG: DUF58 domain-containing protein [Mycobacterium kyogaense]